MMFVGGLTYCIVFVDTVIYDVDVRVHTLADVVFVIRHFAKDGESFARRPGHEV